MSADYDTLRSLLDAVRDLARMVAAAPNDPRAVRRLADAGRFYARVESRVGDTDPALDILRQHMHISFGGDIDRQWPNAFEMARASTGAVRAGIAESIARDAQECRDAVP